MWYACVRACVCVCVRVCVSVCSRKLVRDGDDEGGGGGTNQEKQKENLQDMWLYSFMDKPPLCDYTVHWTADI